MKKPINSDTAAPEGRQKQFTKKCPECHQYMALEERVCSACGIRVGKVDRFGMARKPTDWKSYLICFLAWLGFGLYIWWAFFR